MWSSSSPDLILDPGLSSPLVRTLARQVGARVVDVKDANNFADIRDSLRQVGAAVGAPAWAEALIAPDGCRRCADLAAHPPEAAAARGVAWSKARPGARQRQA